MAIPSKDSEVLRRLAERWAQIAALPVHEETIREWKRLNSLKSGRPLVWINEIPWHEINVNDELTLQCEDPFCKSIEWEMRTTIYQWVHMPGNMVVEPKFLSHIVLRDTGFGAQEQSDVVQEDPQSCPSRHFHPQIHSENDLMRIRMPEISVDKEATERNYHTLRDAFGDILPVEKYGVGFQWFAPWDYLIMLWGVQEGMMDMVLRPELVHAAMERLTSAYLHRLDQLERLNVLSLNNGNFRIGSGGLGYIDELPQLDFNPSRVRPKDQWGNATPQIFSEISPAMHEEFALRYERRWLERFGLTYYGCCEPLHLKVDMLKSVPNLRKISMSPRIDVDRAVKNVGNKYVFSYKPNPAVFATSGWNPDYARRVLVDVLDKTRANGCVVEVILKDITTVQHQPKRLWEWARLAVEVAERYA